MKTRLTLKPGQHGTKALMEQFGDALICVRFRYDAERRQRVKTIELVVERKSWTPGDGLARESVVALRIEARDLRTRKLAKAAGARWNPDKQLWYVAYGKIAGTDLEPYIYLDRE